MSWFLDHYRIGKRRQWAGAPMPILLRLREPALYQFWGIRSELPSPILEVLSDSGEKTIHRKFELGSEQPGFWSVELKTEELGPGNHELLFNFGPEIVHASDCPLLVMSPYEYRKAVVEEAKESFKSSVRIADRSQFDYIVRSTTSQRLRDCGWQTEIKIYTEWKYESEKLPTPLAAAPIQWLLDALTNEFLYLSTMEMNVNGHSWFASIQGDMLHLGFDLYFAQLPSEETRSAVSNQKLSDLHLLGLGGDLPNYKAVTDFDSKNDAARFFVECGIYDAIITK